MDDWSSLEEDESLFDNNGFSGVFSDFEEEGSREDDSTDVEAEVQRGEEEFMSMFANGLGADDRQAGSFNCQFETAIRRKAFLENREWVPSQLFQMVPIIWAKKSQGQVHHVADIILTNRIMAREAGYKSLLAYLKT
jgi:hypothetical protein